MPALAIHDTDKGENGYVKPIFTKKIDQTDALIDRHKHLLKGNKTDRSRIKNSKINT